MNLFRLLLCFDVAVVAALAYFGLVRDAVRFRQFFFFALGMIFFTLGYPLLAAFGYVAVAVLAAGLILILLGAYFSDEKRKLPRSLDRLMDVVIKRA